jgi:Holliday junction resolvase RusA-like endonuclease
VITLYVAAIPPTVNHLYVTRRGGGRCLSVAAQAWYDVAIPSLQVYAATTGQRAVVPAKTRLRVAVTVFGLPRTTDIDNIGKASVDALARALEFDDRWIDDLRLVRGVWRKGQGKGTYYTVEVVGDA